SAKNKFLRENAEEIEICLKEISGFTRLEVNQENVESELEKFAKKVRQLEQEVNEKLVDYKRLQREFNIETRELPCRLNEKDPDATEKQLEELKISAAKKISEVA